MDRRWILGGVLVAGGIGIVRVLTYRPKLDENSRVMLIGDSYANGMALHLAALASDEDLPFIGGAVNGTRVDQWVESSWLIRKLEEFKPSHVFISLGVNDAFSDLEPADVADDAETLVALIQGAGAHPIWIGVLPVPVHHNGLEVHPDTLLAIKASVPYYYDSSDLNIPRGPDGIHPTAAGYAGWAGAFWSWIA